MPITVLPEEYKYYREICELVRLVEVVAEENPTPAAVLEAATKPHPSAQGWKIVGFSKMMYADNHVSPEEKMAQMPRYAYPTVANATTYRARPTRSPTFNLGGLVPELLELIFQNCDLKFIHSGSGGYFTPPLIVALRPEPRLYFQALAVCNKGSHLGWCSNQPSASLSRALPFIRKLNIVLWSVPLRQTYWILEANSRSTSADKDGDNPSVLKMNPTNLSSLLANNRITELCIKLSLLHEIVPPLSALKSFVSELPEWLASFHHLETLSIWIPIACNEGTGANGEDPGQSLYDNVMDFYIDAHCHSLIVNAPFRRVSLFPIYFKSDEDSKPICCEYGKWEWTAKPGAVMDWSKVAEYAAAEEDESDEDESEQSAAEEDLSQDD